jgi:hypothetical protein
MGSNAVNSKIQPDRVMSIRVRQHEFKMPWGNIERA